MRTSAGISERELSTPQTRNRKSKTSSPVAANVLPLMEFSHPLFQSGQEDGMRKLHQRPHVGCTIKGHMLDFLFRVWGVGRSFSELLLTFSKLSSGRYLSHFNCFKFLTYSSTVLRAGSPNKDHFGPILWVCAYVCLWRQSVK